MTNTASDDALAERLRRENLDQFNILVRMHLSFVLDLNTDDNECLTDKTKFKKWNLAPFGKKSKSRGIMEGAPLTQEGICQVYQLIEFLKKEQNISVEGIFRRTGSLSRQQELRSLLNQGITLALEGGPYSVHDCASVLKGFLAELPEPLLTEAHYPAYCQIADLCGVVENPAQESRLLNSLKLLLLLLPSENRVLLKDVLQLLHYTASYEGKNKMSADSLATLFTPHFLCPRKLAPEALHIDSQTLAGILSFMIKKWAELFSVPKKLAVDIRAYFTERERRKVLSPQKCFNESVSDNFAANTVYSFIDHERTAKENQANPTETALAQLYAHIQSLPESSKKRKLVKQFNKENGHGTPLQVLRTLPKNKSLGDSIKKHLFHKGLVKSVKKAGFMQMRSSSEEMLNSPQPSISRTRLFCTNGDSSSDVSADEAVSKKRKKSAVSTENLKTNVADSPTDVKRSISEPDLSTDEVGRVCSTYLTSTPACLTAHACPDLVFTPEEQDRKSMSPITRSTQRMCRAMQETMMTPRSRKPVLMISGTNLHKLPTLEKQQGIMGSLEEEPSLGETRQAKKCKMDNSESTERNDSRASLTSTFREYINSRSNVSSSPTDLSFSSRTDDYNSTDIKDLSSSKLSSSLLHCLDGNLPADVHVSEEKELVLKPKQFDKNGKPIVYETSF